MFTVVETLLLQKQWPLYWSEDARGGRVICVTRDLAAELLESARQMKAGKTQVVQSPAVEARERTGLSQSQLAILLGVSVRTLQGREQGRKQPSGAVRTLLSIARTNPKVLVAVVGK